MRISVISVIPETGFVPTDGDRARGDGREEEGDDDDDEERDERLRRELGERVQDAEPEEDPGDEGHAEDARRG